MTDPSILGDDNTCVPTICVMLPNDDFLRANDDELRSSSLNILMIFSSSTWTVTFFLLLPFFTVPPFFLLPRLPLLLSMT